MEDLSKQQLILLALLISFVTSLATGIFTVSLMSQAPQGVVQSIGQVVEKTIERAVSQNASAGSVNNEPEDRLVSASQTVLQSVVKLRNRNIDEVVSLGIVMNPRGVILADKSSLRDGQTYEAIFNNGTVVPVTIIQAQLNGDVVFLAPSVDIRSFRLSPVPISLASTTALGQNVYSMSFTGTSTPAIGQGIITSIIPNSNNDTLLETTISTNRSLSGSPVYNNKGAIIGIHMVSLGNDSGTVFYSVNNIKNVIPSH